LIRCKEGDKKIDLDMAKASATVMAAPAVPMTGIWRTVRDYLFWSYERGTIQYDVMVTLILLFVFLSPKVINFNDRPVERNPQSTGVVVIPDGRDGLIYQIEGRAVQSKDDAGIRADLLSIIEPVSGEVSISRYEVVRDHSGRILSYKVWVRR
jgi:hypothetical protein